MSDKSVIVIGAGFAGLSAAAILAARGYKVTVFEKNAQTGGRASVLRSDGFVFDMGPSWYWMPDVFEGLYRAFGRSASDFYQLKRLSPSFRIFFGKDDLLDIPSETEDLCKVFENIEPGAGDQLQIFLRRAQRKYKAAIDQRIVFKPSLSWKEYASLLFSGDAWSLQLFSSFHKEVRRHFKDLRLIRIMEFPVLFLGSMPNKIPALYSMMNYAGFSLGTWYPQGGINKITGAIEKIAREHGAVIHTEAEVKHIKCTGRKVSHCIVNDKEINAGAMIAAADYHHVDRKLLPKEHAMYSSNYWNSRKMSPSSLIFYIGVNRKLKNLLHHNLFFDKDFNRHAEEIYEHPKFPAKPLFYVCCPSQTDESVAPEGKENLFLLMPLAAGLCDSDEMREKYFRIMIERIQRLTGEHFENDIIFRQSYCLDDFTKDYHAFKGNAYGLANTFKQTAFLRPRMQHRKLKNLFFAGQLTVPGPGMPPAIISGQIAAGLVANYLN